MGCNPVTREIEPMSIIGYGTTHEISSLLLPHISWTDNILHLVNYMDSVCFRYSVGFARAITPLEPLFSALSQRGIKLGVVTCDGTDAARKSLDTHGVLNYFSMIEGYDSAFGCKPSPSLMEEFCECTGLHAEEIMVVGDTVRDMKFARVSGAISVAVRTGSYDEGTIMPLAHYIIDSIVDLPRLVDELNFCNNK